MSDLFRPIFLAVKDALLKFDLVSVLDGASLEKSTHIEFHLLSLSVAKIGE